MSDNLQFIQPRHFAVHGFFRRAERAERGGVRGIHPPNGYRVKFQSKIKGVNTKDISVYINPKNKKDSLIATRRAQLENPYQIEYYDR